MRLKDVIVGIILIGTMATVSLAATISIPSPGEDNDIRPSLQSAVDTAVNGDVLQVPSGHFKFSGEVTITKLISITGAGTSNTVLYRAEETPDADLDSVAMIHFDINSRAPSNIRVRGITFKSKRPSITPGDGLSLAKDMGIQLTKAVDFKIEGCRFENFGRSAIDVRHFDDLARGVISNNEFFHNAKGLDGLGLGYGVAVYGENLQWIPDPHFGSDNFIFIESNNFDFHRHAIAAGGAGLYVARYNIITNNIISGAYTHAIDAHEARGGTPGNGNYFSTRAVEAYRNTIVNTTFYDGTPIVPGIDYKKLVERAIHIRGGEALVYDNTIEGYRFGTFISYSYTGVPVPYPVPYAIGYQSGQDLGAGHSGTGPAEADGDVFYWGNSFSRYQDAGGTPSPYSYEFHNNEWPWGAWASGCTGGCTESVLKNERDYHAQARPGYAAYPYPHPKLRELTAGNWHTCAIESGAVKCWGNNYSGQLGNGSISTKVFTPVQVIGLESDVTAVSAGSWHTCAIQSGAVKCWGDNLTGQLGNGSTSMRPTLTPELVNGLGSDVSAVSAGAWHTCAIQSGAVKCWGGGSGTPNPVSGLTSGVTAVAVGDYHTCAIQSGVVKCWGASYGPNPVPVTGLDKDVTAVAIGNDYRRHDACAVQNGAVKCWGQSYGPNPVQVTGLTSGVTAVELGLWDACAIQNGAVKCWEGSGTPTPVSGLTSGVTAVEVGGLHTCAIQMGAVWCWGRCAGGACGNGSTSYSSTTPQLSGFPW
jgi:hypothetical protein